MSSRFDDADYPAYSMGRAAEMIGVTPAFLRSLGTAGLIAPERSDGGHRRYSRHQLQLAVRARQLLDEGLPMTAACRIVTLEDQLDAARRRIAELTRVAQIADGGLINTGLPATDLAGAGLADDEGFGLSA